MNFNMPQDKKVIALTVLAVVALVSLFYGIFAKPSNRASIEQRSVLVSSTGAAIIQGAHETERSAKRTQFRTRKRNPFIPNG